MNVPEITAIKDELIRLQEQGFIKNWELPYENLLTRRDAAHFFVDPPDEELMLEKAWEALSKFDHFYFQPNEKQLLSKMKYEVRFNSNKDLSIRTEAKGEEVSKSLAS